MYTPKFPISKMLWRKAKKEYSESNRTYYNERYILDGFKNLKEIKITGSLAQEIGWIAHRVANHPDPHQNTIDSIKWLENELKKAKLNATEKLVITEAKAIIESLENYEAKVESAIPIIDISLNKLGNDWETFSQYAWNLRDEAPNLSLDDWISRSQRFSQQMLKRETIFLSPIAQKRWENKVRENLKMSLVHHPLAQGRLFGNDEYLQPGEKEKNEKQNIKKPQKPRFKC